jgi:hypothetical protein
LLPTYASRRFFWQAACGALAGGSSPRNKQTKYINASEDERAPPRVIVVRALLSSGYIAGALAGIIIAFSARLC